jgi:hypothetical protein
LAGSGAQVTGLTNGTSYTFEVMASNASGTGPWSAPSTAVTPYGLPGAPAFRGPGEFQGSYIIIWWEASSSNGSAVTNYEVAVDGGAFNGIGLVTSWRHSGLNYGQTHTYQVRAVNARGSGSSSGGAVSTLPFAVPPIPYCPGSGTRYNNIPLKTTNLAGNGTLVCPSIWWQFEMPGQYAMWHLPPLATSEATLRVRYTNGYGLPASTTVTITTASGSATQTVSWPVTGTWQNWQWRNIPITVEVGTTIRIDWSGPAGTVTSAGPATASSLNIDQVQITVP